MNFKDVAIKNLRTNVKKYLSYFLCSSFSIMFFFIYATLVFNQNLSERLGNSPLYNFLIVFLLLFGLYGIIFISYAHSSFIKYREKEFGLLMTLGMTKRSLYKLIKIENIIISLASIGLGLVTGTFLSKIFFMIVKQILDLKGIPFTLNYKSYVSTIGIFIIIFCSATIKSKTTLKKFEIATLLKGSHKPLQYNSYYPYIGFLGVILTIGSLVFLDLHVKNHFLQNVKYISFVFIGLSVMGVYIALSNLGNTLIYLFKKKKNLYYKNLLYITEIRYKFSQNNRILFVMTLIIAIVIYFLGSTYSMHSITLKEVASKAPYDFMYVTKLEDHDIIKNEVEAFALHSKNPVTTFKSLEFMKIAILRQGIDGLIQYPVEVVSSNQMNNVMNQVITVNQGEAILLLKMGELPTKELSDKTLTLVSQNQTYEFAFIKEMYCRPINIFRKSTTQFMVILNDMDFAKIKEKSPTINYGIYDMINVTNWNKIDKLSLVINSIFKGREQEADFDRFSIYNEVSTKYGLFKSYNQENLYYSFLTTFIGLLFFFSAESMLYFKLFTDIEYSKDKYKKLTQLGMLKKNIKNLIAKELRLMFFIPFSLGVILGFAFLYTTIDESYTKEFLLNSLIIVGIYFIFQLIYYLIARKKYADQVLA